MSLGSVGSPDFTSSATGLRYEINNTIRAFDSTSRENQLVEVEMILPSTQPAGLMPINIREVIVGTGSPINAASIYSANITATVSKTSDVELQTIVGFRID